MINFIDLAIQQERIKPQIDKRISDVLAHGQYIMGPEINELEMKLADYIGSKHCISVSNGTDALMLSLMALGIGAGDEVIVPDFSFYATSEVVSIMGAKPVFVDINKDTYNINLESIEKNITNKTKAIIAVSLYGQCADFDEINELAAKNNIIVIEDGAQSFGASYKGKKSLNLSKIGCTSFFPSKPLGAYGDGGACFTDDDEIAQLIKEMRVHGQHERYFHSSVGMNARMDTLQAAILLEKLEIFDDELDLRQKVAKRYSDAFKGAFSIPHIKEGNLSAYAQYTIRVKEREKFRSYMSDLGIPTAVHYPETLSRQPVYSLDIPNQNSIEAAEQVVSLPMYPYLESKVQDKIIRAALDFLAS